MTTKPRILVVAHDAALRAKLARRLMAASYAVELAEGPKRARAVVASDHIALAVVIADRLGAAGLDLVRELRTAVDRVITVPERVEVDGRAGSPPRANGSDASLLDDAEIMARIETALGPQPNESAERDAPEVLRFEGCTLDVAGRSFLDASGKEVKLRRSEIAVLLALARRPGRVLRRDELRDAVGGRGPQADDRSIDVLVWRLRRKIEADPKQPRIITAVPGEGYRFTADMQTASAQEAEAAPVPSRRATSRRAMVMAAALCCLAAIAVLGWALRPWVAPEPERSPAKVAEEGPVQNAQRKAAVLVPEAVPFISDHDRSLIRDIYLPAPDHKALALSATHIGFLTGQQDDETAKAGALDSCRRVSRAVGRKLRCELYAIGNTVVSSRRHPPMPSSPWLLGDPAIERPFASKEVPLVQRASQSDLTRYAGAAKTKALALSPQGSTSLYFAQAGPEEAMRRALERCGSKAGVACMIIALDDVFVIPIPTKMNVVGLFQPGSTALSPEVREAVAQRIGDLRSGWNAVATGAAGHAGIAVKAPGEQDAIELALNDCAKQDRDCRVIAIGPFAVGPK